MYRHTHAHRVHVSVRGMSGAPHVHPGLLGRGRPFTPGSTARSGSRQEELGEGPKLGRDQHQGRTTVEGRRRRLTHQARGPERRVEFGEVADLGQKGLAPPPPTVRTVGSCDLEGLATRHPNTSSSLGTGVFEQVLGTRAVWGKGSIWFPKTSFGGLMWTQETLSVSSVMSACGVAQRLFWPKEQAFFRGFSLLASSCHFHHFHSARHSRHR